MEALTREQVDALRKVLEASPEDHAIRAVLADKLAQAEELDAAVEEYLILAKADAIDLDQSLTAARLAIAAGMGEAAKIFIERANQLGAISTADLAEAVYAITEKTLVDREASATGDSLLDELSPVTFSDVGGLDDVKKVIIRMIILPLRRPDVYRKYGRRTGGGVLMYGPPGCGKSLIARATAGEVGLPFFNIRIEDILDPHFGMSERRLADAFAAAREMTPCVLFIDEIDALGFSRARQQSGTARSIAEILLQELDSGGSANDELLVLAATNEPWDVDTALARPGRFDRRIFVPPPDREARLAILERQMKDIPTAGLDLGQVAAATNLYSGADLVALVEAATDSAIEKALVTSADVPVTREDLSAAMASVKPSTIPWLSRAKNHAEFSNIGGRYDDMDKYLKKRPVNKAIKSNGD